MQLHSDAQPGDAEAGDADRKRHRLWLLLGAFVLLVALALAWRYTPLSEYLTVERLSALLDRFGSPWTQGLAAATGVFVASLFMVPLTVLAVAAGLVLGGWLGFVCATAGAIVSAAVGFWLGHHLGNDAVKRLAGKRIGKVNEQLAHQGVFTIAVARLVPAAPFTLFNLVAGASALRFRPYILGSLIALAPGIGALTLFSSQVRQAFMDPSPGTLAVVAAIAIGILAVSWFVRKRLG